MSFNPTHMRKLELTDRNVVEWVSKIEKKNAIVKWKSMSEASFEYRHLGLNSLNHNIE